jgi:hypothetical protein
VGDGSAVGSIPTEPASERNREIAAHPLAASTGFRSGWFAVPVEVSCARLRMLGLVDRCACLLGTGGDLWERLPNSPDSGIMMAISTRPLHSHHSKENDSTCSRTVSFQ